MRTTCRLVSRRARRTAAAALLAPLGLALTCAGAPAKPPEPERTSTFTRCEDPRPELCTQDYVPVCAELRCADPPCPERTFSNGCAACTDPDVVGHRPGSCEQRKGMR